MYQKLYKSSRFARFAAIFGLAIAGVACHPHDHCGLEGCAGVSGLAVGAVVNATGQPALAAFERWRYADQLASLILEANPELSGRIDSYEYVAKRVGESFPTLVQGYRLEGELSSRALDTLQAKQLRRRYLLMASILPVDTKIELSPSIEPVAGLNNSQVQDYYDLSYQTLRVAKVRVEIYDAVRSRRVFQQEFRSDDGGVSLATENNSRRYVGNSLLAALSNAASNIVKRSANVEYPKAPPKELVLSHIWRRVATALPSEVY